ncbi:MAG: hypothetical protein Ct9H90mP22_5370 [Gammaproteobacteria bacterium]|nr:MAG: hypothetical protein Ct9H90mP22_5370 [Gammaproteobacteria bacterium]
MDFPLAWGQNPEGIRVGGKGSKKRELKFGNKDNIQILMIL